MLGRRKELGAPLKTLTIGWGPEGFQYDIQGDYTTLERFVDDIRVGCHTKILEWGVGNETENMWSTVSDPKCVSPIRCPVTLSLITFYSATSIYKVGSLSFVNMTAIEGEGRATRWKRIESHTNR